MIRKDENKRDTLDKFYGRLLEGKSDDALGEALRIDEAELTNLFPRTFERGIIDKFKKSLA